MKYFFFFSLFVFSSTVFAQTGVISGRISDGEGRPVEGATATIESLDIGSSSDAEGAFRLVVPANMPVEIVVNHLNYHEKRIVVNLSPDEEKKITVRLEVKVTTLQQVEIRGDKEEQLRSQVSVAKISPKTAKALPTPFGEFTKILATLPGVVSQNEFSSTYMVRGGNYDENLVYVNDIPIYRPFLTRSGQQEGLSFVNTDLVDHVEFSSGGWQSRYGDKLSSNLNIYYKQPTEFKASLTGSLLGGAAHLEGQTANKKIQYLVGARHKRSQYLLNTLETEGEYLPQFTDVQALIDFNLGNSSGQSESELQMLFAYAHNDYLVVPENRETTFGNIFDGVLRLFVAFDGRESLSYNTYQGGIKFTRRFNRKLTSKLIVSAFHTREREYFDIEGGYRICDVDKEISSEDFDKCIALRGIGTNYRHGRNRLEANVINVEEQLSYMINPDNKLELGVGYSHKLFDDRLEEYAFLDSADYSSVEEVIRADQDLSYNEFTGFVQNTQNINGRHILNYGIRFHYLDFNEQFLISPRFQYAYHPAWNSDIVLKASVGWYRQPPFYREFRSRQGELNKNIKAQSSVHFIAGIDYNLKIWDRDFKFTGETYYKYLYDVIPYDIENVRIRYFAENSARAYAMGADFRLSGEFIPGAESWFSLGILSTREDLEGDERDFIRRPSDQRVTASIFFEDHLPNDPTTRMNMNLLFGSGLPFGPPGDVNKRNSYSSEFYQRVDIGFSKLISLNPQEEKKKKFLNSLWIGVEILNLLGNENAISYTWVKDFNNVQYGVPNTLSARFLNVKLTVN